MSTERPLLSAPRREGRQARQLQPGHPRSTCRGCTATLPSFLRETERNLPVSTTAPFTVTLYVPDSQPMLPETPTSVFGFKTNTAPPAFELAMSLVK